jgi:hypothetical protein
MKIEITYHQYRLEVLVALPMSISGGSVPWEILRTGTIPPTIYMNISLEPSFSIQPKYSCQFRKSNIFSISHHVHLYSDNHSYICVNGCLSAASTAEIALGNLGRYALPARPKCERPFLYCFPLYARERKKKRQIDANKSYLDLHLQECSLWCQA